jgi:hypothetical protein
MWEPQVLLNLKNVWCKTALSFIYMTHYALTSVASFCRVTWVRLSNCRRARAHSHTDIHPALLVWLNGKQNSTFSFSGAAQLPLPLVSLIEPTHAKYLEDPSEMTLRNDPVLYNHLIVTCTPAAVTDVWRNTNWNLLCAGDADQKRGTMLQRALWSVQESTCSKGNHNRS